MSNELQKDEMYLPGGLGTIKIGSRMGEVIGKLSGNDGAITITLRPILNIEKLLDKPVDTEDIDHEVVSSKTQNINSVDQ